MGIQEMVSVVIQEMVTMDMAMVHHRIVTDALGLDVIVQGAEMVDMDHPMAILQVIMDALDLHVGEEMVAMEGPIIFPPATMVVVVDLDVVEVAAATVDPQVAAV